jgi:hypothetical protein
MKKLLVYAIILVPIFLVWLHWGGIKNDMGTFTLMMVAVFNCTVAADKMHEKRAKAEEEKK